MTIIAEDTIENALRTALSKEIGTHSPQKLMIKKELKEPMTRIAEELNISFEVTTSLKVATAMRRDMARLMRDMLGSTGASPVRTLKKKSPGKRPPFQNVLQFIITLDHLKPACWRRIQVPDDFSFAEFALAIHDAFEWYPFYHLHGFSIHPRGTKAQDAINIGLLNPDNDDYDELDERTEYIADYFGSKIKQCTFTYDFGDNWDHTILLEGAFPIEKAAIYPKLLDGAGATPPDDCGGVWGYMELLETLKNPKHPSYHDMREWLDLKGDETLNPDAFDKDNIIFGTRKEYEKTFKDFYQNMGR